MADDITERVITPPPVNPESKPYWAAANEGKLLVGFCKGCGQYHHYPRGHCPFCHSGETERREASGEGVIYSFSATLRGGPVPWIIAHVTLAEGPTMLTNIVDADWESLKIGQGVRLTFKPASDGQAVPMFTPA